MESIQIFLKFDGLFKAEVNVSVKTVQFVLNLIKTIALQALHVRFLFDVVHFFAIVGKTTTLNDQIEVLWRMLTSALENKLTFPPQNEAPFIPAFRSKSLNRELIAIARIYILR